MRTVTRLAVVLVTAAAAVLALQAAASAATAIEYGLLAAAQLNVVLVLGLRRRELDLR